jgi:hypothetical protein
VFQPAKEVKMEKRMKTVSKSIDLAVASRSVVPELLNLLLAGHMVHEKLRYRSEIYLHTYSTLLH